jgi:hypothetical protein
MAEIDLAFIARQLERLVNDVAGLKDDMTVVVARLDRLDATTHSLVTEVRANSRHDRVAKRVERLEDANPDAPSDRREPGTRSRISTAASNSPSATSRSTRRSARLSYRGRAPVCGRAGCASTRREPQEHALDQQSRCQRRRQSSTLSRRNAAAHPPLSLACGPWHHAAVTAE